MRIHRQIGAAALLLAAAAPLHAAQFTFDVPVDVRGLPPAANVVSVACEVLTADGGQRIAYPMSGKLLPGGAFAGTITVAGNTFSPISLGPPDPRLGARYICHLTFTRSDGTPWEGRAAPGAVTSVSGPIPSGH
jgi:hypothetical protein